MAQNFWTAIFAWSACFLITIGISLITRKNRSDAELKGLVYSLTPKPAAEAQPWFERPVVLGSLVLGATLALNLIFA